MVPDFCVEVAFEKKVVKGGAFEQWGGGWGVEWSGWV
jgi:hypothetical protein